MKQKKSPQITVFCDLPVLIAGSVCFVGTAIFFILFAFLNEHNSDPHENMIVKIMLLILGFGGLAIWLRNLPQWSANALLTEEGIYFRRAFKKTVFAPYAFYQHLYRGEYYHGTAISGMGSVRAYVVFSKERLSSYKLGHINTVPPSPEIIKLRSTKRNLRKLQQMLPEPHRGKPELLFR